MAGVRSRSDSPCGLFLGALIGIVALGGSPACRQMSQDVPPPGTGLSATAPPGYSSPDAAPGASELQFSAAGQAGPLVRGQTPPGPPPEEQVLAVRVVGSFQSPKEEIIRHIRTRAGRPYDPELIEEDVRRLNSTGKFADIRPYSRRESGGRVVFFQVWERPVLRDVKYVGNRVPRKKLEQEAGIKPGDALDPSAVEQGRQRLEEFYQGKGFAKAQITIIEGNKVGDREAIYLINEGPRKRILWTNFVGNTIASDAKLRTKIQSKPGILLFFKGVLDRRQIDEDVDRLIAYYRSLGFFRAHVGRELESHADPFYEGRQWVTLTFVIDEGPRYVVRDVSLIGNSKFSLEELADDLKLKPGQFFNQAEMEGDRATILEKYGAIGYAFADVIPQPLLFEEPGELDLVYEIQEGRRFRVGRIEPDILSDSAHTRITTILDRLSLYPGDILDVRKKRASERRLQFSRLFEVDPAAGMVPKIVLNPPDLEDMETGIANQPGAPPRPRGQSPDPVPARTYRPPEPANPHAPPPFDRNSPAGRSQTIIRGQYSAEAGQSAPPLRRPRSWLGTPQPQPIQNDSPPTRSYLPSADPLPAESVPYDGSVPPVSPEVGAPRPSAAAYGDEFEYGGGGISPDGGWGPGWFPPGGPTAEDASTLLGLPPGEEPPLYAPLRPEVWEARTGRLMFTLGFNSEAGLLGSVIVDQQNFDWTRLPRSWDDVVSGRAWQGAGQRFRVEAIPGSRLHKYTISFQDPYWRGTNVSLGLSGYFYNRRYFEWEEEQVGGRVALGYQFAPDLFGTLAFRGSKIQIFDPIVPTPDALAEVLGPNALYGFRGQLTHDTRDHMFLPTEGHLFEIGAEQVIGSFDYTRGDIDLRRYFLLRQHPDGSGRHVLSLRARAEITGSDTPIYEHYFAGGFSTIRGFDFRGASPKENGVFVGGHFMLLGSMEYMFPITADDTLRAVVFCDTGAVQPAIDQWTDNYRVAPGVGLRILIPAMGPAPIALDFAFPVSSEPGDDEQVFSISLGFMR